MIQRGLNRWRYLRENGSRREGSEQDASRSIESLTQKTSPDYQDAMRAQGYRVPSTPAGFLDDSKPRPASSRS